MMSSPMSRPNLGIVFLALGLIAAVWAITVERLSYDRERALAGVSRDTASLALGLEEHVARTLKNINHTLAFVRHEYLRDGRSMNIFKLIEDGADASILAGLQVIGPDGEVLLGTGRGLSVANEEYFRIHVERNDDQLFIGKAFQDKQSGRWTIALSRRMRGPDGLFAGVVATTVDPAALSRFYADAGLGGLASVTVARIEGQSLIRQIGETLYFGDDQRGRGLVAALAHSPSGTFLSRGTTDGLPRYVSYRTMAQFPVVVALGLPQAEALALFLKHRRDYHALAVMASVFIAIATWALLVAAARRRRVLDSLVQGEARLRASEQRLRDITNAVPVMIAYFDADRTVRFHNTAFDEWFGLVSEGNPGGAHARLVDSGLHDKASAEVDEVLRGYPVHYERSQENAKGELRDLQISYYPRYGEGAERTSVMGYYALLTDITAFKRVDRMKSEFVSTVSHELRTPLTSIRGSLGLLAGGIAGALPQAAASLVAIAKSNCERLIRLINDILDTEKIESGQMRFDLQVAAIEPVIRLALTANEGFATQHKARLTLRAPQEALWVHVDSGRLIQVMTNLLSNAVKFSPPGAVVEVAIAARENGVRVEVRDQGCGIGEEFRSRIFQKFSQADSSDTRTNGGTGLGLNISKAIIERLGGTMGFTTETGRGSTFYFELPRCEPNPALDTLTRSSRPCILLCEEEPDATRLITLALHKAGYSVDSVRSATQARKSLAAKAYAAAIVDLELPAGGAMALVRGLRHDAKTRDLPIITLSARANEGRALMNNAMLAVSACVDKPIDEQRLVAAIRFALEGAGEKRPRILHVEDDPDVRRVAAAIARDFASFDFASTLRAARECLQERPYDLVLLDIRLPDGSGWTLVDEIEALVPPPPIVVFAAEDLGPADSRRVHAALVKSRTSNEVLIETLQRVLDRKAAPLPVTA